MWEGGKWRQGGERGDAHRKKEGGWRIVRKQYQDDFTVEDCTHRHQVLQLLHTHARGRDVSHSASETVATNRFRPCTYGTQGLQVGIKIASNTLCLVWQCVLRFDGITVHFTF